MFGVLFGYNAQAIELMEHREGIRMFFAVNVNKVFSRR
jgi:hypothetical protein